jgi:hypothetical protein
MRTTMLAGAIAAAMAAATHPGVAQVYTGPWCAHVSIGDGDMASRCDMRSFEMCRQEIIGQGPSYCSPNPYYRQAADESPPRKVKKQPAR